ncbi:unnamed protein product [Dibothriocephalus latus]|uniref:Uncharacterized protein n=1 Tax=Dibothriocephalus latus TaxID=60516 RepID=A0A3P6ST68_DIBLA|nr:unnamed protein product [Dibothriocephalus latus]
MVLVGGSAVAARDKPVRLFGLAGVFVKNTSWHNLLPTIIRYEDAVGRKNWPRLVTDNDGDEKHEDDRHLPANTYFRFDGTQHLNLTALRVLRDISKGYLTQFSLLFWVYPANLTSKNSLLYSSLPIDGFSVAVDEEHVEVVLRAVQDSETATYKEIVLVYAASISPETWQHIAVVYTGEDNMPSAEPNVSEVIFL